MHLKQGSLDLLWGRDTLKAFIFFFSDAREDQVLEMLRETGFFFFELVYKAISKMGSDLACFLDP